MAGKTAAEDEKLTDKSVEQRKTDQGKRCDHKQGGEVGHALGQPAVSGELVSPITFIHEAKQYQQRDDEDALVVCLVDRSIQARNRKAKDAQFAKAERADGG